MNDSLKLAGMVILAIMVMFLGSCISRGGDSLKATPTLEAVPSSDTNDLVDVMAGWTSSQLTQQAAAAQQAANNQAATQTQVVLEADQRAAVATAQVFAIYMTATMDKMHWDATVTSGAVTALAEATRSADQATVQAAEKVARMTTIAGEAEQVRLATDRERMTNDVRAWGGWIAALAIFIVALVAFWMWSRVRVIPRDARGDAQPVVIDGLLIDPDRIAASGINLRTGMPLLIAPDLDTLKQVVSRDQAIDLVSRHLPGQQAKPEQRINAVRMLNSGGPTIPQIDVIEGAVEDDSASQAHKKLLGEL